MKKERERLLKEMKKKDKKRKRKTGRERPRKREKKVQRKRGKKGQESNSKKTESRAIVGCKYDPEACVCLDTYLNGRRINEQAV